MPPAPSLPAPQEMCHADILQITEFKDLVEVVAFQQAGLIPGLRVVENLKTELLIQKQECAASFKSVGSSLDFLLLKSSNTLELQDLLMQSV